ncbi:MAG: hypothetical protein AB7E24_15885 [Novosphingobium sp.]
MKSNTAAHLMSATGEIFSHDATSADHEKIFAPPVNAPAPACATTGDVTLTSKSNHACHTVEKMRNAEFEHDLQHLTKMQLRRNYPGEANSHRNMLTRTKQVHPAFRQFRDFLRLVGPMPVSGATLDRIDNTDPEYAPGKVRWADKRTQNNNKGDTLTIYDQQTDEVYTASRIAKLQGVSASAVRQRLARGWSHAQIIAGTRSSLPPTSDKQVHPAPSTHSVEPRAKSVTIVPLRSRSTREIEFERMADEIAYYREHYGVEEMFAPLHELNEDEPDTAKHITEDQWMARFERLWPEYRPHIIFERADPYHQRAIELIDPEYVKRERAKITRREEAKALV